MTKPVVQRTSDVLLQDVKNRVRTLEANPGAVTWESVGATGAGGGGFVWDDVGTCDGVVRGNTNYAWATFSGNQNITDGGNFVVDQAWTGLGAGQGDESSMIVDVDASPARVKFTGHCMAIITLNIEWSAASTGKRNAAIEMRKASGALVSGTTGALWSQHVFPTSTEGIEETHTAHYWIEAGDSVYIVPIIYNNSGSTRQVVIVRMLVSVFGRNDGNVA